MLVVWCCFRLHQATVSAGQSRALRPWVQTAGEWRPRRWVAVVNIERTCCERQGSWRGPLVLLLDASTYQPHAPDKPIVISAACGRQRLCAAYRKRVPPVAACKIHRAIGVNLQVLPGVSTDPACPAVACHLSFYFLRLEGEHIFLKGSERIVRSDEV